MGKDQVPRVPFSKLVPQNGNGEGTKKKEDKKDPTPAQWQKPASSYRPPDSSSTSPMHNIPSSELFNKTLHNLGKFVEIGVRGNSYHGSFIGGSVLLYLQFRF